LRDPVYLAKEAYLRTHGLCVFHLHDNVHRPGLDDIAVGMAHKLKWEKYRADDSFRSFRMPGVPLKDVLRDIDTHLKPTAMRYIGDQDVAYENIVTSWGFMMMENGVQLINRHKSCVLVAGETHEWELVEYAHDANQMGLRKALIVVGHVASEEGGMEFFSHYLQEKAPSHPVSYIRTNDLFKRKVD